MGFILGVGAVVMHSFVITSCFFQRIQEINPVTGEKIPGTERGYGFISRETDYGVQPDYQQCTYYPPDEIAEFFDSWVRASKAMAFLVRHELCVTPVLTRFAVFSTVFDLLLECRSVRHLSHCLDSVVLRGLFVLHV